MTFHRRDILKECASIVALATFPRSAQSQHFAPQPGSWRQFEIVTRLEIAWPEGKVQAWIPVPSVNEAD